MTSDWTAYETVLRDLRVQKANIEKAILAIEALRPEKPKEQTANDEGMASEHGAPVSVVRIQYTVVASAMKVLKEAGHPMHVSDILKRITEMGVKMNSEDPANTLGSILNRRRIRRGDVMRVGRGTWAVTAPSLV